MNCIHGMGSSVVYYVISTIPTYNQIVNFDLLDDHEPDFDHRPLTLTLNSDNQRHLLFDKYKVKLFLKYLSNDLKLISYHNNIKADYKNFTTTLSTSINNFSIEVIHKKKNNTTNPWYDNECKIVENPLGMLPLHL